MNAVLHKFPFQNQGQGKPQDVKPAIETETFDQASVAQLNDVIQNILSQSDSVLGLFKSDRELARKVGIESLCIEIVAILEGDKFDRVVSATEEAIQKKSSLTLTRDGLSRVRRLESLLSEAAGNIGRFVPAVQMRQRSGLGSIGQLSNSSGQLDGFFVGSMVVFGAITVIVLGAIAITYIASNPKAVRR